MKLFPALVVFAFLCLPSAVYSFPGEIFKVETSGTEYCGDFNFSKFSASNNVDMWVRLDSETQLTVSLTSNFVNGTTFPMYGQVYLTGSTSAAFVAGVLFDDLSWASFQGNAKFDKLGNVLSMAGTFVQNGVLFVGCFSSGKAVTVQKLN